LHLDRFDSPSSALSKIKTTPEGGFYFWWNKCVKIRTRKGFQSILSKSVFYTFKWNILGSQGCVTSVEDDVKIVVVQVYRMDKDVD